MILGKIISYPFDVFRGSGVRSEVLENVLGAVLGFDGDAKHNLLEFIEGDNLEHTNVQLKKYKWCGGALVHEVARCTGALHADL